MEKSQYDLCMEVLRRLGNAGILQEVVVVGSWCTFFYEGFFGGKRRTSSLTTRDMDLLIPEPGAIKAKADVAELLRDLGFVIGFSGSAGYIRLEHPELIVEFLVPERGRGTDKPYPLPQLGVNAQALRFLDYLSANTIKLKAGSVTLRLPHPANFALHKFLVLSRRAKAEKQTKDKAAAIKILVALIDSNRKDEIRKAFCAMPKKWQLKVGRGLAEAGDEKILKLLQELQAG